MYCRQGKSGKGARFSSGEGGNDTRGNGRARACHQSRRKAELPLNFSYRRKGSRYGEERERKREGKREDICMKMGGEGIRKLWKKNLLDL